MSNQHRTTISLEADGFHRPLRLLVCNYIVQLRQDLNTGSYFITPHGNYSTEWSSTPPFGLTPQEQAQWGGIFFIGDSSQCLQKLTNDFATLASKGFNAVRIFGIAPTISNGTLSLPVVPTGSASLMDYLALLDDLLGILEACGLKAILLVGWGDPWRSSAVFRDYLRVLSAHLKDNRAVLAYDLYNEPAWSYPLGPDLNKYRTAHWVADSVWTIRRHAPRHLVTIGLSHPETVFGWDPHLLPVDFVSYHFYGLDRDPAVAGNRIASMLYWASQTSRKPWIIGETGFSGTDEKVSTDPLTPLGSAADQKVFAEFTLQRSLDCGCMGYSWWQYQDVHWATDTEDWLGLITRTDPTNPANSERHKPALAALEACHDLDADPSRCVQPDGHANWYNYPVEFTGTVVDHWGNPLANAVIAGNKRVEEPPVAITNVVTGQTTRITVQGQHDLKARGYLRLDSIAGTLGSLLNGEHAVLAVPNAADVEIGVNTSGHTFAPGGFLRRVLYQAYSTFSAEDGTFALCASYPATPLSWLQISRPGYTAIATSPVNGHTYSVEPVQYNRWCTRWTNHGDGTIDTWSIGPQDRFYVGDFDGDGADELLCAQTGGNADLVTVFRFEDGDWQPLWSNAGDPAAGDGLYPYRHNFLVGDFDGDGKDELLGNDAPGGWMTLFAFSGGDWHWRWSDYGNLAEPLRPYRNSLTVGDFDGDGKDDLLGGGAGGWTTWFTFDAANNAWTWVDSDYGTMNDPAVPMSGLHPYARTAAGDFDGDGRDEVLGQGGSWITLFGVDGAGTFRWVQSTYGRPLGPMHLMGAYHPHLVVGDFDGDGKQEILGCSDWVTMFRFTTGDFRWAWSTFNDRRIADFKTGPGTKYFAFRASPYVPSYLLAIHHPGTGQHRALLMAYVHDR